MPLPLQAEARQLAAAETNCRAALKASGGCHPHCWALLALLLSARQEIPAALAVASAALEEAGPAHEGLLLKIKVAHCACHCEFTRSPTGFGFWVASTRHAPEPDPSEAQIDSVLWQSLQAVLFWQ